MRHLKLLHEADRVVYLVDEPFSRKSQAHRGRIPAGGSGGGWLTLPVLSQDKKKPLQQVRIEGQSWADHFMKTLASACGQAVYHDFYEAELRADFENAWRTGRPPQNFDDGDTAQTHPFLLPMIQHLNKRLFSYLELPDALLRKPEWITTSAFTKTLEEHPASEPLRIWIEPRGSYFRELGNLPPHAEIYAPEMRLPAYSRGVYEAATVGDAYCLLDLLLHHGPQSFRVLDLLFAGGKDKNMT